MISVREQSVFSKDYGIINHLKSTKTLGQHYPIFTQSPGTLLLTAFLPLMPKKIKSQTAYGLRGQVFADQGYK